jgi:hypothetical protein
MRLPFLALLLVLFAVLLLWSTVRLFESNFHFFDCFRFGAR